MLWFMEGICFLPFFLVIWSSSTFIVSYLIALFEHDVDVIFPYISDTGAKPPESCVFGLMTVITAFASMATMYARYKFVEKLNEKAGGVPPVLNQAALWIGTLSCLGMCFVATFQETTITAVHDAGALLFFVSGVLYTILQSIISYKAFPYGCSLALCRMRTGIATIAFLAVFPTVVCAVFVTQTTMHRETKDEVQYEHIFTKNTTNVTTKMDDILDPYRLYRPEKLYVPISVSIRLFLSLQDYVFHLVSAVSEWIVAFSFIFFFFTYIHDFKKFTLKLRTEFVDYS